MVSLLQFVQFALAESESLRRKIILFVCMCVVALELSNKHADTHITFIIPLWYLTLQDRVLVISKIL